MTENREILPMSTNTTDACPTLEKIKKSVYTIRGQQVMLDIDLAEIYGYDVKALNQQVKRNISRFPEDFMFQLHQDEINSVKSQIVTSPNSHFYSGQSGGRRKPPYAFTEQGIYMLATVLKGELAEQQSIFIMRAFRQMRIMIEENRQIFTSSELISAQLSALVEKNAAMEKRQNDTDANIRIIQNRIDTLNQNFISDTTIKSIVIYKNQKFEADMAYIEIFARARKSIYLIDDYLSSKTLQLLSHKKKGVDVILFSENKGSSTGKVTQTEINDFNNEYPHITLLPNKESHDRFIILDYNEKTEEMYHCGASVKDAGAKVCGINQIQEPLVLHPVIERLLSE